MSGGLGFYECPDYCGCETPCVGCQCDESATVQLTSTWTNHVCNGCETLNTILIPKVASWPYIGNGDTCHTTCDPGCHFSEKCWYYIHLEPDCTPPDLLPYLFCGGGCSEEFPCSIENNCNNGFGEPACGTIGTGILPADYNGIYHRDCVPHCSADVSCVYNPETDAMECVGGYGGTLTDCNPLQFHGRVVIYQTADKERTAVTVSFVCDGAGLFAKTGCAIFDGPCSELDVDVPLFDECLTGIPLNGCIIPDTVNVKVI